MESSGSTTLRSLFERSCESPEEPQQMPASSRSLATSPSPSSRSGQERVSVVTPTLNRPAEISGLLDNLSEQSVLPWELVVVDASEGTSTRDLIANRLPGLRFPCTVVQQGGGTAIQRNYGIDRATGDFIAFVDDDIRLEPDFLEVCLAALREGEVSEPVLGGVTGYISNQFLDPATSPRWRLYRFLRLFSTYVPGRYDFATGYPINRYLQPAHEGVREVDFMGAGCAVWRSAVFEAGLRFSEFFVGHGVLEDAHLALRAGRTWGLAEVGRARCIHLRSPGGRENGREVGYKSAVNYRFVFKEAVPERSLRQEFRFWWVQAVDLMRFVAFMIRRPSGATWSVVQGKLEGLWHAARM